MRQPDEKQSWLIWFLRGVLILVFIILIARVVELQVIKGSYYRRLSEGNRIRRIPLSASRGKIIARGGEVLVGSRQVESRVVIDQEEGVKFLDDSGSEGIPTRQWQRDYPLGTAFAHVGGYLGFPNEAEVGKVKPNCIEKGPIMTNSKIGRTGLEQEYDCLLGGLSGEKLIEVDTAGKFIRVLGEKEPIAGTDLHTKIDYGIQRKIAEVMKDKKGAVVVTNTDGEVLGLYSAPSFDPNLFTSKLNSDEVSQLLEDQNLPLFNRAISGNYHPGSVFKPVVAMAALEEGKIDRNYRFVDNGIIEIKTLYGDFAYTNWYFTQYGRTEGEIDLPRAIARSTDTFFYQVGELLGIEKIIDWSEKFNLDKKSGIDLPGEVAGFIPTPEWKERVRGERWFLGNTYHVSIGQGDIALTPVLVNQAISAIATGKYCRPSVAGSKDCWELDLSKDNVNLVKEGMAAACRDGGTAFPFFDFSPDKIEEDRKAACKTGTAETSRKNVSHAWFSVFAPVEFPEIVVTVFVEEGGEGSSVAAPIAREILDYYFGREN